MMLTLLETLCPRSLPPLLLPTPFSSIASSTTLRNLGVPGLFLGEDLLLPPAELDRSRPKRELSRIFKMDSDI